MTLAGKSRPTKSRPVHGIDRLIGDVRTGRFERGPTGTPDAEHKDGQTQCAADSTEQNRRVKCFHGYFFRQAPPPALVPQQ